MVRPRGWHLDEKHILIDGVRASGSLTDFALYMATSAQRQLDKGKGPYFYLAKNESHLEARLWNDAFNLALDALGIPRGTIRATVLIETILAAFEMEEILYELREHSSGLNAGQPWKVAATPASATAGANALIDSANCPSTVSKKVRTSASGRAVARSACSASASCTAHCVVARQSAIEVGARTSRGASPESRT